MYMAPCYVHCTLYVFRVGPIPSAWILKVQFSLSFPSLCSISSFFLGTSKNVLQWIPNPAVP